MSSWILCSVELSMKKKYNLGAWVSRFAKDPFRKGLINHIVKFESNTIFIRAGYEL